MSDIFEKVIYGTIKMWRNIQIAYLYNCNSYWHFPHFPWSWWSQWLLSDCLSPVLQLLQSAHIGMQSAECNDKSSLKAAQETRLCRTPGHRRHKLHNAHIVWHQWHQWGDARQASELRRVQNQQLQSNHWWWLYHGYFDCGGVKNLLDGDMHLKQDKYLRSN